MQKLYVAMVGLPARGKSTLARRIRDGLAAEGIRARLFNNGDVRRARLGAASTDPDFYNPDNTYGRLAREQILPPQHGSWPASGSPRKAATAMWPFWTPPM